MESGTEEPLRSNHTLLAQKGLSTAPSDRLSRLCEAFSSWGSNLSHLCTENKCEWDNRRLSVNCSSGASQTETVSDAMQTGSP